MKDESTQHDSQRNVIFEWNLRFPLDRWWRKKYNVAFNSPQHRTMSLYDIYLDYLEDIVYDEITLRAQKDESEQYIPGDSNWIVFKDSSIDLDQVSSIDDLIFGEDGSIKLK